MKGIAASSVWTLIVLGALFSLGMTAVAAPPNIVYILLDDAGYGDLGCYGQKKFATPNIDRLATEGIRFTQHYSGSTVCAPTRASLMTGLHTGHAPVRGNKELQPEGQFPIPDAAVTVAELLKGAGYATGCFGKWGLGGPGSEGDALKQGFDTFFGYYCQRLAHDHYPRWVWHDGEQVMLNREKYSQDLIIEEAMQFIRENQDGPFFCYLPVLIPHAAMQAPEEYHARFRALFAQFDDKIGKYSGDERTTEVVNPIAGFAAMMTKLDDDIGRVLGLLEELGIDQNTVVMLSSDNGPHKEGGHDPEFWNSNGPHRGTKRDVYDGGVRVPFLVRWPGVIEAGRITDHVSAHWDMLPTFCALAGIPIPSHTDGISMLPTLTGEVDQPQHDYLYWEFYEQGGKRGTRFGDWKAVQLDIRDHPDAPVELYNIVADPGETQNVAAQHPEKVQRVLEIFKEAHVPDANWEFR